MVLATKISMPMRSLAIHTTLQRKFDLCIPGKETVLPHSHFLHSYIIVRHCLERNFYRTPARIHSEKEDEEKSETGVTKGSYLLLTGLSSPLPPSSPAPRAYCIAWGCVIGTYPPLIVHPHRQKSVIFRKSG
jgi:hypothetical protein